MEHKSSNHILDKESIVKSINNILNEIITENMDSAKTNIREEQKSSYFFAKKIPSISIISYLERMLKYTKMEDTTLVVMLIFIDKLCEKNNFLITENNVHR